jgi:ketosteroid isomerase-like protein
VTGPREEIARRLLERWGQPDFGAGLVTDDFVMEQHGGTMQGIYRGAQGMRDYAEGFGEAWVEAHTEIDDLFEHGDAFVTMTRLRVKGRGSGIEVEISGAGIVRFADDGKVTRADAYTDRDEALKSVGLPRT